MTTVSQIIPLDCLPGVEPVTDNTAFSTKHYSMSQNIRFQDGKPQKIGGWNEQTFDSGQTINGVVRSIYSTVFINRVVTMIGSHTKLYTSSGSKLYDITPVGLLPGRVDEVFGQGYGMGMYGVGLYGTALLSMSGRQYPRIWFFDKFGDYILCCAGNQTGIYRWDGATSNLPVLVPNAPIEVNYSFVSDNILVTFGADNIGNRIFSSDQGDITNWTASSLNNVFDDNIEGAGRLTSHVSVDGINVIFTEQRSYTMRYVGKDAGVWQIKELEPIGLIAPMARVVVNGIAVWMGMDNFYMYRGGSVEIVPSNSLNESTILDYVFKDLNFSQKSKSFAWYNKAYNEIWFHYPSASSNEPNRVACVNVKDFTWWPLEMDRTAAEYPETNLSVPRLATPSSKIYRHEAGNDDVTNPLPFSLTFNKRAQPKVGKNNTTGLNIIPDSFQTGDVNFHIDAWQYPQSTRKMYSKDYTISSTTEFRAVDFSGKVYQYTISGNELGQQFVMGQWAEDVQAGGINP